MDISKLKIQLENAQTIAIIPHINPDGDALGSMIAMYIFIKMKFDKEADMLLINDLPELYEFLPFIENIKFVKDLDIDKKYDLAISVDVAAKDRMAQAMPIFDTAKFSVNIDHHRTNDAFGDLAFINPEASSTGEIIYDLMCDFDFNITKDMATAIYTAIVTDTGGFRFENTKPQVLVKGSKLIEKGVDSSSLFRKIYDSKPKAMVMLNALCVSKAQFLHNNKIAYTFITKDDFKQAGAKDEHTCGIAEVLRQINTTEVAIVLKENESGFTKVSMRSKTVDIAQISQKFDGGGHKFAAGCTIKKPPAIALNKLLEEIVKVL